MLTRGWGAAAAVVVDKWIKRIFLQTLNFQSNKGWPRGRENVSTGLLATKAKRQFFLNQLLIDKIGKILRILRPKRKAGMKGQKAGY